MTNCVNCGAVLHGSICEYCGTKYNNNKITASFNQNGYTGTIRIGDKDINVYISSMENNILDYDSWVDENGVINVGKPTIKRKITLTEI